ncbi:hypothetical protein [Brucella pseudogrignonensis]|uniref:hypothetical protein n=1 Tax=Brucella pseudogrignonensis TaxID=419475 RepID=UPI003ED09321
MYPKAYLDDIRLRIADDASNALIELITGRDVSMAAVTQDQLSDLIERLEALAFEWEKQRRAIDPNAGKPGDVTALTVTRPTEISTAKVPDFEGVGVVFQTNGAPRAFAITNKEAKALADRLILEANTPSPKIVRN